MGSIKAFEDNIISVRGNIKKRFNYYDIACTKNEMNVGMNIENIILDLFDGIHPPPKHETVEQWENRTGQVYPDDGPVWYMDAASDDYDLVVYRPAKMLLTMFNYKAEIQIIVANHHGKPKEITNG